MREHVLRVRPKRDDLVDTAGTGGDGANTWNISTAAALVAAAAGAGVAKHGNRAASSATGAADVLEALGFELELPPERIEQSIDELGFAFLFAQAHHPAMKYAARSARARGAHRLQRPRAADEPGRRTCPGRRRLRARDRAHDRRGARPARRAPRVRRARRGRHRRALPRRPEPRLRGRRRPVRSYQLDPEDLGIPSCDPRGLRGADPETNARELRNVVEGEVTEGAHRDAVLLNAAGAIAAAGHAADLREGLALARVAIDSGAAGTRLDELIAFSRQAVSE